VERKSAAVSKTVLSLVTQKDFLSLIIWMTVRPNRVFCYVPNLNQRSRGNGRVSTSLIRVLASAVAIAIFAFPAVRALPDPAPVPVGAAPAPSGEAPVLAPSADKPTPGSVTSATWNDAEAAQATTEHVLGMATSLVIRHVRAVPEQCPRLWLAAPVAGGGLARGPTRIRVGASRVRGLWLGWAAYPGCSAIRR
jgi:hypothetical protein